MDVGCPKLCASFLLLEDSLLPSLQGQLSVSMEGSGAGSADIGRAEGQTRLAWLPRCKGKLWSWQIAEFREIAPKWGWERVQKAFVRNENSAQRGSFGPDIPADFPPKTSVRPSKSGLIFRSLLWRQSGPHPFCTCKMLGCTGAKQGFGGARALFETFAPLSQKTFCTLS